MKYFWLLFSVFLCSLSVYPCSDNSECETKTELSKTNTPQKNHPETEHCTPFCSCACCGVPSIQNQLSFTIFKKRLVPSEKEKQLNFYSFRYEDKMGSKIWQPPKIA